MTSGIPGKGARVAILARYSSNMQNPKSADDQIREADAYALRNGWNVVMREKDEAKSGRTTAGRTGFFNVMGAAEARKIDVILVEDITRFARDAAVIMNAKRRLQDLNVSICTYHGGMLTGLELAIRAQMAEEQAIEIGRRVQRGKKSGALRGNAMGSLAFGHEFCEARDGGPNRRVDESKRSIIVRIFEDLAAGVSTTDLCRQLNSEGVPSPDGKAWRPKTLTGDPGRQNGIARNPIYIGKLIYGKSKSTFKSSEGRREVQNGAVSEQVINDVPSLRMIDDTLWQTVQELLDGRGRRVKGDDGRLVANRARGPKHPLSGLIKCGECSHTYVAADRGRLICDGRKMGVCSNSRGVQRLNVQAAVFEALRGRLLLPSIMPLLLTEYRREYLRAVECQKGRAETLAARQKEVAREIEKFMKLVRDAPPGAASLYNDELERLARERKQLDQEGASPPLTQPLPMDDDAIIARVGEMLDNLSAALEGGQRDAARARDILRSFITRVVITPLDGESVDGRGSGPVRVTVEGRLAGLLGVSHLDYKVQRGERTFLALNLVSLTFSVYLDLPAKPHSLTLTRTLEDADVTP